MRLPARRYQHVNVLKYLWPARNEIIVSVIVVAIISGLAFFIFLRGDHQSNPNTNQNSISVNTNTEVINGTQNTANLGSTINWKKQVNAPGVEQLVDGTIVEQISADQEYVYDSLQLPEGWTATWSFDPIGTPENQRTYRSEPPNEGLSEKPTYIKINTGTKDTFRPSVVAPIGRPVAEKVLDSGKRPSAPVLYKKKIYLIMRGVKAAADPTNANTGLYTIDCYDTISRTRCSGYPGYFSSDAGPITSNPETLGINSGTKDLNTAQFFESYLDDGTYGNEGRLYFPAQKGKSYGIGCVNILTTKNCGYTSLGDSDALSPSGALPFPTLISGFAEKDGKLYGHANDMDLPRQKIICFDLNSNGNGEDAPCDGFTEATLSRAPTYKMAIHRYIYRSIGSHSIIGNKLYYAVDYLRDFTAFDSQVDLKAVLFCFDVSTKAPCPGTGGVEGWSHPFGGAPISKVNEADVTNTYVWKKPGNVDHAICVALGLQNETLTFKTPATRCYDPDTGIFFQGGGDAGFPTSIYPTTWWPAYLPFVPWRMGPNELNTTNAQGEPITYFALYSTADSNIDSTVQNGATLCYNWEKQQPCEDFGYKVRYWFEVGNGQSGDVGYTYDGACMWASGDKNVLWSFDPRTGEFPCRSSQTELTISAGDNQYYCDNSNRAFSWDKVRLAKTNLYNFHTLRVTVRNADTDAIIPVQGNNTNDMKQTGTLDISSIPYQQNQRLKLEVVPTVFNTSPWANNQTPKVSAILNSDNVQYCFDTKPKQFCDLRQLTSVAGSSVVTDTNTITGQSTGTVNVRVPDNDQCYKDVRVSVTANKNQIRENEDVSYTVRVEHKGKLSLPNAQTRGRIQGARIEVTIPNSLEYVSSTNGGRREGNKVIWSSQEFIPESVTQRQVTFRPKTTTSQSGPANVIYAATTQQPVTVQAAVISGDDIFQSDNTSSNNSVILITEVPEETGGGQTETPPAEEPTQGGETEQPIETPETPAVIRLNPADPEVPDGGPARELTPRFISNVIPPALRNQTETLFKLVNSAVTPIPNPVAVALPYGTIAFLMAFASIYVYQAIQEGNNRKTLLSSYKRFKRTEELRRNYVDLTSHYLNTPIATMQASIELMETTGEAPATITEAAKLRLNRVVQHVRMLLSKADELTSSAQVTASVMEPIAKKRSLLSTGVVVPVIVVLLITAIINAIFVWADKYSASLVTVAIQSLYFALSFIAMLLAFNSYRNQKYATAVAEHELGLEKKLTASQTAFIANTSKTIEGDIVELEQMSPTIASTQKGSTFVSGLQSLKKATSKLDYLNRLTNHSVVPTLPNQTIKALTDDVVSSVQNYATQKKVTLEVNIESGLTALVDEDGLRQILYSTIHNAIKFNRPGGRAILSISRQGDSNIKIIVKDNGEGIAKDKIDQLFTPFGRGTDSKEYNFEGFGLDLYMNKLIAEQCGGSITLDSTKDVGTTITIILPA